jgi:hypothetical protein
MSTHMSLDCDGFAAALADYLEGDAPIAVRDAVEAHAAECAACRQLLEELGTIRHDAAALPALVPSRDLWSGIAERIDAKVVPFDANVRTIRTARRSWARPAMAAAALVIVTAGITHLATKQTMTPAASIEPTAPTRIASAPTVDGTSPSAAAPVTGRDAEITSTETERGTSTPASGRTRNAGSGAPAARLASAEPLMRATEPVYDREILKLRQIVKTRREQLDPKTIAVLEQSMAVIDSAIAQSRAALAKDPASGFLATQLNHSLEKKVELLRTAALLPART